MDKQEARRIVRERLLKVARPDSRFHFNFGEYITDFEGSDVATRNLIGMDIYQQAKTIFITPDNSVEQLKAQAIRDGKTVLTTTYGIYRGFLRLTREDVPPGMEDYAVLLDLIERFGHYVTLAEIRDQYQIDLMVTGGMAVSKEGVRFGKGHGFFDLEWAMLYSIGAASAATPMIAFVHDCQIVDFYLEPTIYDTLVDYIVTPGSIIKVDNPQ
ncbi:MAG: hypothetical protein IT326_10440, partial [Anaerolineae bacterium]|nr:hypothetical protein [Anaerolineae bacterium]